METLDLARAMLQTSMQGTGNTNPEVMMPFFMDDRTRPI